MGNCSFTFENNYANEIENPSELESKIDESKSDETVCQTITKDELSLARQILTQSTMRCAFMKFCRNTNSLHESMVVFRDIENLRRMLLDQPKIDESNPNIRSQSICQRYFENNINRSLSDCSGRSFCSDASKNMSQSSCSHSDSNNDSINEPVIEQNRDSISLVRSPKRNKPKRSASTGSNIFEKLSPNSKLASKSFVIDDDNESDVNKSISGIHASQAHTVLGNNSTLMTTQKSIKHILKTTSKLRRLTVADTSTSLPVEIRNKMDTITNAFAVERYNMLRALEECRNEVLVILVLGYCNHFQRSPEFREWCASETMREMSKLRTTVVVENGSSKDMLLHLAMKRNAKSVLQPLRPDADEFEERTFAKVDQPKIFRILEERSWVGCLLSCLSVLPIGITISRCLPRHRRRDFSHTPERKKSRARSRRQREERNDWLVFANQCVLDATGYGRQEELLRKSFGDLIGDDPLLLANKAKGKVNANGTLGVAPDSTTDPKKVFDSPTAASSESPCASPSGGCSPSRSTCLYFDDEFDIMTSLRTKEGASVRTRLFFRPLRCAKEPNELFVYVIHYNVTVDGFHKNKVEMYEDLMALLPKEIPADTDITVFPR